MLIVICREQRSATAMSPPPHDEQSNERIRPDVALVRPRDSRAVPARSPVQDPLGVGYIAAVLRMHGFDVVVVDAHALGADDAGVIACLAELRPRIVGFSLHSFSDYVHCAAISSALRQLPQPPYCAWGGEHATFLAQQILLKHPEVDAIVLGEGEYTFCDLVKHVSRSHRLGPPSETTTELCGESLADVAVKLVECRAVAGAIIRGPNGALLSGGPRRAIEDLDELPAPDKDVIEVALACGRPVTISVLTGRGCTHHCRFCTAHKFLRLGGGPVWRRRSPRLVADEVERLSRRYLSNPLVHPVIQFQDVIFLGTSPEARAWIGQYLDELESRHLYVPFYCMTRADSIIANEKLLPRLVRAGLWAVEMGIESGVDRILQLYNKHNCASDNERAVWLLRRHGITFDASGFIMFDPRMTVSELRHNADYLARFGGATWDFFVTRLQLYPGTEVRKDLTSRGLFDPHDDIACTSGYSFEDALVGVVAEHTFYYDLSIRDLDLALRDAKAILAKRRRCAQPDNLPIAEAIRLVHRTYCQHILQMTDLAESGNLRRDFESLVSAFLNKVAVLRLLLQDLLQGEEMECQGCSEPGSR